MRPSLFTSPRPAAKCRHRADPPRRRPARLVSVRRCTSRAGRRAAWRGSAPWQPSACSRAACPPRARRGGLVATAPPARRAHESFRCHLDQRARWAAAPLRTRSECGQRAGLRVPSGHTNKTTVQSDQGLRESAIDTIPSLDSHVPISLGVLSHHAWFAPNATAQQSDSASA